MDINGCLIHKLYIKIEILKVNCLIDELNPEKFINLKN